jgi:hypothetical protein
LDSVSDDVTNQRIRTYIDAHYDNSLYEKASKLIQSAEGRELFFAALMLQDGESLVKYFDTTRNNILFNLRRIYYPIAKLLFEQKAFKEYIIRIGLFEYWKNHQFPKYCNAVADNGLKCS